MALVNGGLLSLFGLAQHFSTNQRSMYWSFETTGQLFGPFINRNHFATYINLCLALSIGLLLKPELSESARHRRPVPKPTAPEKQENAVFSPFSVLHSPHKLWVCIAIMFMLSALLCSQSRGGVASISVGLMIVLGVRLIAGPRVKRLELILVPAVLLIGFLAWTGIKPQESRLAALWEGGAFDQSRWSIWTSLITLFPQFPILGSGYGTLLFVEPLTRTPDVVRMFGTSVLVDHAHNEYLEALVEGGLLRFGLTCGLVSFVVAYGVRALRRWVGRTPGALAFGGLLSILALALQSSVEFSISTPAVAVFAAVIAAHLMALARSDPATQPAAAHAGISQTNKRMPVRLVVVGASAVVSLVIVLQAWQTDRVHRLRLGAFQAMRSKPARFEQAFTFLAAATRVAPDNTELHLELGQLYLDARERSIQSQVEQNVRALAALLVGAAAAPRPDIATVDAIALSVFRRTSQAVEQQLTEQYLRPALREMVTARNLCPLLPRPHMRLAAHAAALSKADVPASYWARARRLAPSDAELWYFSGLQSLRENRTDDAWAQWKRSLSLSGAYLPSITDAAAAHLTPSQLLVLVLPDNPVLLYEASRRVEKNATRVQHTRPILERALALLDALENPEAKDYYLQAKVLRLLVQSSDKTLAGRALRAYELAIGLNPTDLAWREEYARYLEANRLYRQAYDQIIYIERNRAVQPNEFLEFKKLVEHELK